MLVSLKGYIIKNDILEEINKHELYMHQIYADKWI